MKRVNTGKVLSIYKLEQVKSLNEEFQSEYIEEGYGPSEFIQTDGSFDDEEVPHEDFAKFVYNNAIKETMFKDDVDTLDAMENSHTVTMSQSDWVETVSEDGHKAFDTAVVITASKISGEQWDVCTAFFRVEVRDFEV